MGAVGGGIGGMFAAGRTKGASDRALRNNTLSQDFSQLEMLTMSYDELVATGRINPNPNPGFGAPYSHGGGVDWGKTGGSIVGGSLGFAAGTLGRGFRRGRRHGVKGAYEENQRIATMQPYLGLKGNESRLSRGVRTYEESLAAADPIFAAYQQTVKSGLEGIENGGIPNDLRRSITETLRQSQAQRGIIDSNVAATEEVVRLMGGSEAVRAQRLGEAQNYFGQVTAGAISAFLPNMSQFYAGELNRSIETAKGRREAAGVGAQIAS